VTIPDREVAKFTQDIICRSPKSWLDQAERHFKSNLDFLKPLKVKKKHTVNQKGSECFLISNYQQYVTVQKSS